jgi:hypothetical protein
MIVSASKDGFLILWSIEHLAIHENQEEMLKFNSDLNIDLPITKAKWLSASQILVVTTQGELFLIEVKTDS